jgi:hypothetical protein
MKRYSYNDLEALMFQAWEDGQKQRESIDSNEIAGSDAEGMTNDGRGTRPSNHSDTEGL